MNHENVQFEFMGFDPDYEIRNFITSVADKLHFSAPSDASMTLVMQKGKGAIKASCRIVSQAGTFVADAISDSPVRAVQQIDRKIKLQLDNWKAWRFEKENFREAI